MKYICQICGYVYDEETEGVPFGELPDNWTCPMCKAPKNMFLPEDAEEERKKPDMEIPELQDMERLPPGVLAALFSNLAKGAEKQYQSHQEKLFREIAAYYEAAVPEIPDADISLLMKIAERNISLYGEAMETARRDGDRGAMRALTWGGKVQKIITSILSQYEKEGESALENVDIWVCTICGFIYTGENPPAICPVCKVPSWKFSKVV